MKEKLSVLIESSQREDVKLIARQPGFFSRVPYLVFAVCVQTKTPEIFLYVLFCEAILFPRDGASAKNTRERGGGGWIRQSWEDWQQQRCHQTPVSYQIARSHATSSILVVCREKNQEFFCWWTHLWHHNKIVNQRGAQDQNNSILLMCIPLLTVFSFVKWPKKNQFAREA